MSTRSRIGIYDDATDIVTSIYCHSDGYLTHNGQLLLEHYQDAEKVELLMEYGNRSALTERPSVEGTYIEMNQDGAQRDISHRVESLAMFKKNMFSSDEEFAYLFKGGIWKFSKVQDGRPSWKKLVPELVVEAAAPAAEVETLPSAEELAATVTASEIEDLQSDTPVEDVEVPEILEEPELNDTEVAEAVEPELEVEPTEENVNKAD